jgi:hypothetical protein
MTCPLHCRRWLAGTHVGDPSAENYAGKWLAGDLAVALHMQQEPDSHLSYQAHAPTRQPVKEAYGRTFCVFLTDFAAVLAADTGFIKKLQDSLLQW